MTENFKWIEFEKIKKIKIRYIWYFYVIKFQQQRGYYDQNDSFNDK
jgi:hypothetical protein